MIETEDRRIASGCRNGNVSISSYDINKKTWKRDIHKEKAHKSSVYSLCTLSGNRLVSSGGPSLDFKIDRSIKVWSISDVDIT